MLCAVRLPFADDIRHTAFPPLEKIDPISKILVNDYLHLFIIESIEKLDLIDELIDNFMADGDG